ncbi:MAG: hypothetical protein WA771_12320 [Chthoniobacterales bacterium]
MASEAHVTSVEAIGDFRASLTLFAAGTRRSLDEVTSEIRRVREWIRNDRRFHWENQVRRWRKRLDEAQQELLQARMSSMRDEKSAQQQAVHQAKRELLAAEEKLRRIRHWQQHFEIAADPLVKQLNSLRTLGDHELPKAIAFLSNAERHLDVYTGNLAPADSSAPAESPTDPSPDTLPE